MHDCIGSECTFCAWRKENPINVGWERLLDDHEGGGATVCGVNLTCSQLKNPDCKLSTQQTAEFLSTYDDNWLFPCYRLWVWASFVPVWLLSPFHCPTFLNQAAHHCHCCYCYMYCYNYSYRYGYGYSYACNSKCIHSSPKGSKAVEAARASSIRLQSSHPISQPVSEFVLKTRKLQHNCLLFR